MSRFQICVCLKTFPVPLFFPALSPQLNRHISCIFFVLQYPVLRLIRIAVLQDCKWPAIDDGIQTSYGGNLLNGIVADRQLIRISKDQLTAAVSGSFCQVYFAPETGSPLLSSRVRVATPFVSSA